ncbi:MAG: 1-acyl-sn-glycerol-3-phosphate acyltransferase [Oscillospiraceae bacterium]|jgi:1-acyl-sn-glycerol-3-phosphate acyltransferase|nr:1-acyl-sn-glycerol-3-phosphate acyltransferase [Oscillospiraceae bacterium]
MNTSSPKTYKVYRFFYPVLTFLLWVFGRPRYVGRDRAPSGACIVCANHTSNIDAFFLFNITGRRSHLRILAKAEMFRVPVVGAFLRAIGMIRVDRSIADMAPVKECMAHLKAGGKIGIFPEGHRVSADESVAAKAGAVKLADKLGLPVVPVFIPRKKRLFSRNTVVIGEPYFVNPERKRLAPEEYSAASEELMRKIRELAE